MTLSQDIESRIAILDIVNRYVQTKKAGANYKALCPFHHEKTASFVISPTKNIAKCFSCGKGWGPIRFLMEIEQIEFREAASLLAKEAGIELKSWFRDVIQEKWKDPYLAHKIAMDWYHEFLFSPDGKKALEYLLDRGITLDTIRAFRLGYSGNPRDLLYALKAQGFETSFLIECGLFVSESRDKFFGRVIFPIANAMGNTVAFTGRTLGDREPKYLNSPASRIFDKSSILYGLHLAKQSVMKSGEVYIVEGQMDTIALHQAGIDSAVGISGTALTKDHIRILKRFTKIVYLTLDADDAGIRATFASIENLINSDMEIRVIMIPNGKDPDDYIKSGGDFSLLKEKSLSVIDYYLAMWGREYDLSTMIGKKQLIEKCIALVTQIASPVEVDFYLKHLSSSFDVSRDALYETYHQMRRKHTRTQQQEDPEDVVEPYAPSPLDLLAGYIDKFNLLDLFFANFRYTVDELSHIPWSGTLLALLTGKPRDDEQAEELRTVDLYIEETHPSLHPDVIERHFLDVLRAVHAQLLDAEKNTLLGGLDPASSEYLAAYTQLIKKAHSLGISPWRL